MVEESRVPRTLYKYYPDSSLEYIFKNWTIRFTPAIAFNDPFECLPHVKSLAQKEYIENVVFGNIDDFVEQDCLNNNNLLVARELIDQAREIEQECKQFTKIWDNLWDSDKDMDFSLVSVLEQEDYSYLIPKD